MHRKLTRYAGVRALRISSFLKGNDGRRFYKGKMENAIPSSAPFRAVVPIVPVGPHCLNGSLKSCRNLVSKRFLHSLPLEVADSVFDRIDASSLYNAAAAAACCDEGVPPDIAWFAFRCFLASPDWELDDSEQRRALTALIRSDVIHGHHVYRKNFLFWFVSRWAVNPEATTAIVFHGISPHDTCCWAQPYYAGSSLNMALVYTTKTIETNHAAAVVKYFACLHTTSSCSSRSAENAKLIQKAAHCVEALCLFQTRNEKTSARVFAELVDWLNVLIRDMSVETSTPLYSFFSRKERSRQLSIVFSHVDMLIGLFFDGWRLDEDLVAQDEASVKICSDVLKNAMDNAHESFRVSSEVISVGNYGFRITDGDRVFVKMAEDRLMCHPVWQTPLAVMAKHRMEHYARGVLDAIMKNQLYTNARSVVERGDERQRAFRRNFVE